MDATSADTVPVTPIALRGVRKAYGQVQAVAGVDLDVGCGELFGLIGHNGAGKSTLFRLMLGLTKPDAGTVHVLDCPVGGPSWREARRSIGYLPEHLALYDNLSGIETLRFFARMKGAPMQQCAELLDRVGLGAAAKRVVRGYSKGMRQRLGLAQALLGQPQVLFLDEPSNGLDPQAIRDLYATLATLRERGVTIILTSHILAELQQRVDRLAVMAEGSIVALGSVQALREQLAMPLMIVLRGAVQSLTRVRELVAGAAEVCEGTDPHELRLRCARERKMELLARLAPLAAALHDLQIHEPSLEELYFGVHE